MDKLHRPLARYLAAGKYRRKYGGPFVSRIAAADDLMCWESTRVEIESAQTGSAFRYLDAVRGYFGGGEWNAHEVESVLAEAGFSLRGAGSCLEFACGYGRLTRHFVHMIDASKITVADIDRQAVDFVTRQLGVRGIYSTTTAEELLHDGRYDLIVVVSLFSHLSLAHWGSWLRRLNAMLNPEGLLLLTTNNIEHADASAFEVMADGFLYREVNETRGRLDVAQYGATYVDERFVQRAVAEHFAGRLLKFCPNALLLAQDAYVLQRANDAR